MKKVSFHLDIAGANLKLYTDLSRIHKVLITEFPLKVRL